VLGIAAFGRGVRLMAPEHFVPFVVPFQMKGSTVVRNHPLPIYLSIYPSI
jgi:hypothetical protein